MENYQKYVLECTVLSSEGFWLVGTEDIDHLFWTWDSSQTTTKSGHAKIVQTVVVPPETMFTLLLLLTGNDGSMCHFRVPSAMPCSLRVGTYFLGRELFSFFFFGFSSGYVILPCVCQWFSLVFLAFSTYFHNFRCLSIVFPSISCTATLRKLISHLHRNPP